MSGEMEKMERTLWIELQIGRKSHEGKDKVVHISHDSCVIPQVRIALSICTHKGGMGSKRKRTTFIQSFSSLSISLETIKTCMLTDNRFSLYLYSRAKLNDRVSIALETLFSFTHHRYSSIMGKELFQ